MIEKERKESMNEQSNGGRHKGMKEAMNEQRHKGRGKKEGKEGEGKQLLLCWESSMLDFFSYIRFMWKQLPAWNINILYKLRRLNSAAISVCHRFKSSLHSKVNSGMKAWRVLSQLGLKQDPGVAKLRTSDKEIKSNGL